jgi:hypothetical protein
MRKRDLFNLPVGEYELTDHIKNYYYTMCIWISDDGCRCYRIKEKGSLSGSSIFMIEAYKSEFGDEDYSESDIKYKVLHAMSGVGGLTIHSNDTFSMINDLRFIPRGSFKKFVELTSK